MMTLAPCAFQPGQGGMWRRRRAAGQDSSQMIEEAEVKQGAFLMIDFGKSLGTWISYLKKEMFSTHLLILMPWIQLERNAAQRQ